METVKYFAAEVPPGVRRTASKGFFRIAMAAVWAVALAPAPCRGEAGNPVSALLRAHLEALGGEEAVRALASAVSTGSIEIAGTGLTGTIVSRGAAPCLSSSEISLGIFTVRQGYDGAAPWTVDPNGGVRVRRDPASLAHQRTICALESYEYLFGAPGVRLEPAGRDTADGEPCERLRLVVDGGTPCAVSLGDSSRLVRRVEIAAPEGTTVEILGDYRRVGGVMLPFSRRTEIPSLRQRIEVRYERVAVNEPVDPIVFLPPAAGARDWRFTEGGGCVELPFEYRYRHIFLPARVPGRPEEVLFLLDSGASMTVVDSTFAARLGLALGGALPGAGAGGTARFRLTRLPGLLLPGLAFPEQVAAAFPVAGLLRRFEETEIAGILGYDFLSRFTTRIDYARRRIVFFDPDSFAADGRAAAVEAPLRHNIFALPARLDAAAPGSFLLDTGATSSIVDAAYARADGIAPGKRSVAAAFRGAGGEERAALCRFDSLSFAGFSLRRPVLAVAEETGGIAALENVDGVIGNDVLERFTVTFDYRGERALFEPNRSFAEPFYRDRSGLQLARAGDGRIVVVNVLPGSPAAGAGIRPGDRIARVGRVPARRFASIREVLAIFEEAPGTAVRLEIDRGAARIRRVLTLAEYL